MRMDATIADLGDDVVYAVGRSDTQTLLVINSRPVTRFNREYASQVVKAAEQQRRREEN